MYLQLEHSPNTLYFELAVGIKTKIKINVFLEWLMGVNWGCNSQTQIRPRNSTDLHKHNWWLISGWKIRAKIRVKKSRVNTCCLVDFCHYKSRPDAALGFQSLKKEPRIKKNLFCTKYTIERAWKVTKPKQLKAITFQLRWIETNRL